MDAYNTFDEAWLSTVTQLVKNEPKGSRDGEARELDLGYAFTIIGNQRWLTNPDRDLSIHYAMGELLWYLSGSSSGDFIKSYAPGYERFLTNGKAEGAYGPRLMSQIFLIARELSNHPDSRRAVISIFESRDWKIIQNEGPDVPCTCSLQFAIRDGKLECVVYMRSNDVWLGMPYDVFCFSAIQQIIADLLGIEMGPYTHMVGSCHLYERNAEAAEKCLEHGPKESDWFSVGKPIDGGVQTYLGKTESAIRNTNVHRNDPFVAETRFGPKSVLTTALAVVQHKFASAHGEVKFDLDRAPEFIRTAREFK